MLDVVEFSVHVCGGFGDGTSHIGWQKFRCERRRSRGARRTEQAATGQIRHLTRSRPAGTLKMPGKWQMRVPDLTR
ncbi:hypothetical protein GCM10023191_044980 [Actinoallomurus oryzae]|uniref:Uncharacterized protein n=1 Tax=Actinoallomurus oryzae TaxID=502180 RepID=A0ABP8Q7W6_9ACTN